MAAMAVSNDVGALDGADSSTSPDQDSKLNKDMPASSEDSIRVKIYELRDTDWVDCGTGFCSGAIINVGSTPHSTGSQPSSVNLGFLDVALCYCAF